MSFENNDKAAGYWREKLRLVLSLLVFVALIFVYVAKANTLDKKYNVQED